MAHAAHTRRAAAPRVASAALLWLALLAAASARETPPGATAAERVRLDTGRGFALNIKGTPTLYVNGVPVLAVDDTTAPLTTAGKAGFMDGIGDLATKTATTGIHFDNFQVKPGSYPWPETVWH